MKTGVDPNQRTSDGHTTRLTVNQKFFRMAILRPTEFSTKLHTIKSGWSFVYTVGTHVIVTGQCSTVSNMSDYRCVSDCKSRGRELDPSPVPYFRGG